MKHRKYTCLICKKQVTKEGSYLVETPCNRNKFPNGIGRSRVCKHHHGVAEIAIPEPAKSTETETAETSEPAKE